MRKFILAFLLFAGALQCAPAWAYDFVFYTQNLLRFGQGNATKGTLKCQAMATESATADIMIIQELMTPAYPCTSIPAGFKYQSFGPLGTTSYKEYYGFLWRATAATSHPVIEYTGAYYQASQSVFMRPPTAMFFKVTRSGSSSNSFYIWIADIHSVFGKTVAGRRAEATAAGSVFNTLRTSAVTVSSTTVPAPTGGWPVIIAGDWNVPVTNSAGTLDAGFTWLTAANANGLPSNVATSLTRAGAASSPYDHIVFNRVVSGKGIGISTPTLNPPNNTDWPTWRTNISDHLGVQTEVTVQ